MIARLKQIIKRILFRSERRVLVPVQVPVFSSSLLKGRYALITGGSKGIGFAIAKAFVNAGCNVHITGRDVSSLEKAVADLSESGMKVSCTCLDITRPELFENAICKILASFGPIDVLVNNAGVNDYATFPDVEVESYNRVMDTNLRGSFFIAQAFAKHCVHLGKQTNILNICSSSSLRPGINPYVFSKWGMRSMTVGLAKKLAGKDCVVNGLAPGLTSVERVCHGPGGIGWNRSPVGRMATPEEIANMAVILVSDISRMVIGDVVFMTGGMGVVTVDDNI